MGDDGRSRLRNIAAAAIRKGRARSLQGTHALIKDAQDPDRGTVHEFQFPE